MNRRLQFAMTLSLAVLASACSPQASDTAKDIPTEGFGGTWVMQLGTKTFIVLRLEKSGESFTGTLERPARFQTTNGRRFSHFTSEVATETVVSAVSRPNQLHLETRDSKDSEAKREYDMTLVGQDTASLKLTDAPLEAWFFTRVRDPNPRSVSTDWEPRRSYSVDDNAASNPLMQRLYDEDQELRKGFAQFSKEAEGAVPGDADRRSDTRRLIAEGQLHTGEDYTRAAAIFQHGNTPDDFLLAHALAVVGAAKGEEEALWIASATLDRYLHSTGKRQVFGTQIKEKADHTATLDPYDRELIADTIRRELGVQPIAAQEDQLQIWSEQFKAAASGK
jgi:hypothetical protein